MNRENEMKDNWNKSFNSQIKNQAYNTAPVEALIRVVSYFLRNRYTSEQMKNLNYLEMGCGAGPNLVWLAQKGIKISGIDISPVALEVCKENLKRFDLDDKVGELVEGSVTAVPFPDNYFDGVIEACVFQHLNKAEREKTFSEVKRVLKQNGLFVGYMLEQGHTTFQQKKTEQLLNDPGTILLKDNRSNYTLESIGLTHFFSKEELFRLLEGFSTVDLCLTTYFLPKEEANRRGYEEYLQSMWIVYAIK